MVTTMNILSRQSPAAPDQYSDEVLNASWLPHTMLLALGLKPARRGKSGRDAIKDPDNFLQRLYRSQE